MSTCSVEEDENLIRQFQKTPGTPTKNVIRTPRTSGRKRALFQPSSPVRSSAGSDDLGPMSPLSNSSCDSYVSTVSPCFSPNGNFSTPPKTPVSSFRTETLGRVSTRKIEVKSSLFPNLKIHTPRSRRSPGTPRRSQRLTPRKNICSPGTAEKILQDLTTPPKSLKKRSEQRICSPDEDDVDSAQKISDSTPRRSKKDLRGNNTPVSKLGIKTISSESFYGTAPAPRKVCTQLFIDTLGSKLDSRKRARSLSVDSMSSNRSFVSGLSQPKKRKSEPFVRPKKSNSGRRKGPHIGVWHGVKKPKKMKFAKSTKKPLVSPQSRVAKMLECKESKTIQCKPKPLLEEKKRRAVLRRKKTSDDEDDSVSHGVKGKKLPTTSHPSGMIELKTPDPNKMFMKYGMTRKATFTLSENMKLQYSNGVMKLQSPKKRRKFYTGKTQAIFDFGDEEDKISEVKENIENILTKLDDDKDEEAPSKDLQIKEISQDQLLDILDSPDTRINLVNVTPSKVLTEIHNGSGSKIPCNFDADGLNSSGASEKDLSGEGEKKIGLGATGSIVSRARNILYNPDETFDGSLLEDDPRDKFFSVFYKENWNKQTTKGDETPKSGGNKKKTIKVPDDQYLLDAGQKSIGIVTCPKCGVMYQAGDFADEATHRNFHNHLPELRFSGWANERVVGKYPDGRVIMIIALDMKSWWQKVAKVVDIVDQELGFPSGSVSMLRNKTVYFYISDKAKQIVGCLIAEECKEAFRMFPPLEGVDVDSCSKDPSPCKVGISRVWTALNHRRRGVAKRMIDCMRRTFIFGEMVPMDLVAFSVPSPSGKLLAQNVTGRLDYLVYGFA